MNTVRQRQRKIVDEVRNIRNELRKIATSLHPDSDVNERATADKKITELEKRIDYLEAQKTRGR